MKRVFALILAVSLIISAFSISCFAVEKGECGDDLSWEYISVLGDGELHIYGSGAMDDFEEGKSAWSEYASTIQNIYLSANITHIGAYAFANCGALHEITLPKKLTSIGEGAFKNSGLFEVSLSYQIEAVEKGVFSQCDALEKVDFQCISSGMEGEMNYYGLKRIGDGAFEFCSALTQITLPLTLETIGNGAFESCSLLSSVIFNGNNLTSIGESAFSYCTSLEKISLPNSISEIKSRTFAGSTLKHIDIPENVKYIGEEAFGYCESLAKIDVLGADCSFYDGDETTPDTTKIYVEKTANKAVSYAKKYSKPYFVVCLNRAINHKFDKSFKKATASADGYIKETCSKCNYVKTTPIYKIASVSLLKINFVYNGKKQYPSLSQIKVLDSKGKKISASYYSVSVNTKCVAVGRHSITVTFKGNYSGKIVKYFNIIPKGTAIKSVGAGKGTLKVNWAKQRTQTSGYHIRYSRNKNFTSGVKNALIKKNTVGTYTLKSLARKKGYYIQIRTYKSVGGKNYYSAWSKTVGKVSK